MLPIAPSGHGYSGWELVVDRTQGAGYPDALLLGTPPYGSLNEREIGTTFGLRAQDAIAWEPRNFHFLTSTKDMERAKDLFLTTMPPSSMGPSAKLDATAQSRAFAELLAIIGDKSRVAAGQFAILDAKLKSGVADPPAFAQQWAMNLARIPHTLAGSDLPSPRGELLWLRFTVTMWLPGRWKSPAGPRTEAAKCAE